MTYIFKPHESDDLSVKKLALGYFSTFFWYLIHIKCTSTGNSICCWECILFSQSAVSGHTVHSAFIFALRIGSGGKHGLKIINFTVGEWTLIETGKWNGVVSLITLNFIWNLINRFLSYCVLTRTEAWQDVPCSTQISPRVSIKYLILILILISLFYGDWYSFWTVILIYLSILVRGGLQGFAEQCLLQDVQT